MVDIGHDAIVNLQYTLYVQVEGHGMINDHAYFQCAPASNQLCHRITNIGGVHLRSITSAAKKVRLLDDMETIRNRIKMTVPILWVSRIDPFLHRALLMKFLDYCLEDGDIVALLELLRMQPMHPKMWYQYIIKVPSITWKNQLLI